MNIKSRNSLLVLFLLVLSFFVSGCASTTEEMRTREALVILIQKVERLERLHCIPLYAKKHKQSRVLNRLPVDAIKLRTCDKLGWCRVSGYNGYVQKWLVVKAQR
jgi:hypothetical protein